MSKLLEKYNQLKMENKKTVYLFEKGSFYVALNEDAELMNKLYGLKIITLGKSAIQIGFPITHPDKYTKLLDINNYEYKFISPPKKENKKSNMDNDISNILNEIQNLDISQTTPVQALNKLSDYQKIIKSFYKKC